MAARRGAARSQSAKVPLAVRWAWNGEGDAGGIIDMYELRQVLHAAGLSSEGNKEELVERIRNNKEVITVIKMKWVCERLRSNMQ